MLSKGSIYCPKIVIKKTHKDLYRILDFFTKCILWTSLFYVVSFILLNTQTESLFILEKVRIEKFIRQLLVSFS